MTRALLTPRWIITSLLVLAGVALCIRLGLWQLDRLEQRRAFNTRVSAQMQAAPLDLNGPLAAQDLEAMEYRTAFASGRYDASQSVLLRNQVWENRVGYHLLVPLITGSQEQAVLVNLGWIPPEQAGAQERAALIPAGEVKVRGMLRSSQSKNSLWGVADPPLGPGQQRMDEWNFVTLPRIGEQTSYVLLPVYLQAAPEPAQASPPHASLPEIELNEGSHLGYALQWFAFASILGFGYPFFIRRQLAPRRGQPGESATGGKEIEVRE